MSYTNIITGGSSVSRVGNPSFDEQLDAKLDSPIEAADMPTGIDAVKIGDGSVSDTEFGYLNGVTSALQTQISALSGGNAAIVGYISKSANQSDLSSGSDNVITWDTEHYDQDGYHSTSSNTERWTIPSGKDGDYLVITQLQIDYIGDNTVEFTHRKNGTRYGRANSYRYRDSAGYYALQHIVVTPLPALVATDYIDCVVKPPGSNCVPVGGSVASCTSILVRLK